jgi:hypothetical protein
MDESDKTAPSLKNGSNGITTNASRAESHKEEFSRLVRDWKQTRGHTSSAAKLATHPSYQKIIAMGQVAVPLILQELEREPDHWFLALRAITGTDPVPEEARGKIDEMTRAWLVWGADQQCPR